MFIAAVVQAPSFDEDDGFAARPEPFDARALIAEFAVEALIGSVLPGLSRVDERCLDVLVHDPLQDRLADDFWAVIGAQERRSAALADQAAQDLESPARSGCCPPH